VDFLLIGPILWGHSGPLCHALSSLLFLLWTSILHCYSPDVTTVALRLCYSCSWLQLILVVVSTVATPGEWQWKIRTGSMRQLAVVWRMGPTFFKCYLLLNLTVLELFQECSYQTSQLCHTTCIL